MYYIKYGTVIDCNFIVTHVIPYVSITDINMHQADLKGKCLKLFKYMFLTSICPPD